MKTTLNDLLVDFDYAFPDGISNKDLEKRYSVKLVNRASSSGLIYLVGSTYYISEMGLGMVIQTRTKKAIDKLDYSIKEFNKSSNRWALILTFLTFVMLIAVGFQIILAFYK